MEYKKVMLGEATSEAISFVWQESVEPRAAWTRRLYGFEQHGDVDCRLRKVPWPHLDAYHALTEKLVSAPGPEADEAIALAKEQVIRRLVNATLFLDIYVGCHSVDVSHILCISSERDRLARAMIVKLLRLDEKTESVAIAEPRKWPLVVYPGDDADWWCKMGCELLDGSS